MISELQRRCLDRFDQAFGSTYPVSSLSPQDLDVYNRSRSIIYEAFSQMEDIAEQYSKSRTIPIEPIEPETMMESLLEQLRAMTITQMPTMAKWVITDRRSFDELIMVV